MAGLVFLKLYFFHPSTHSTYNFAILIKRIIDFKDTFDNSIKMLRIYHPSASIMILSEALPRALGSKGTLPFNVWEQGDTN